MLEDLFLISDPHFGHQAMIDYENRPFKNADDMTAQLIKNWNKAVPKQCKIIVAGDVSFLKKEETAKIIKQLRGYKILIPGNHDRKRSKTWWRDVGFDEVIEYPICIGGFFWVSHEPMYMNTNMPYINLHGHTHSTCMESKQYFNVSVENIGYKPIRFTDIAALYKQEDENESD